MARASTRTILSLDRWAAVLGLEPRHFNQITTTIRPQRACHQPWLQYNWQAADRVGREEVAQAIAQAESDIVTALGFYPLPQWVEGEVVRTAQPNDRTLVGGSGLYNPRGLALSVQASLGQIITGGIETKDLIATAVRTVPAVPGDTMALSDPDGDGYDELVTITLPTALTDTNEIRVYFTGQAAADEWEIRPLRSVTIAAGVLTITLDKHLIADPDLWEALDPQAIDGDVNANFVLTVDVYRVWNDPSQQAQLQWERVPGACGCGLTTCAACAWGLQWACLQTRDPRLGILTYQPSTWNATNDEYDPTVLAVDRAPERVRLYYQAGYQFPRARRSWHDMDPMLERMIAYYSVTILDRPICTCDNVQSFVARWTEDLALVGDARYQIRDQDLACPWGTRAGALWAWKQVQRYAIQRAVLY
jgi:hypothetical protein